MALRRTPWLGPARALLVAAACGGSDSRSQGSVRAPFDPGPVPGELATGADLFTGNCRGCHGPSASGFSGGPPLLDSLYLPPGFPDSAIAAAIRQGVRRHHWSFDDMPAVRTVRPDQIPAIVGYVRWLQARWVAMRATSTDAEER